MTALRGEQELLVGFAQAWVAQEKDAGVLRGERARLAQQVHIHLFQEAIALLPITAFA